MPSSTYALGRHVRTRYSVFSTKWHYSLTFHWFLHHHPSMILDYATFFRFLYISLCSFLVPQTLYHTRVRHLRWAILYTMILHPTLCWLCTCSHLFTGKYTRRCTTLKCDIWAIYLQIPPCSFCVSLTLSDCRRRAWCRWTIGLACWGASRHSNSSLDLGKMQITM